MTVVDPSSARPQAPQLRILLPTTSKQYLGFIIGSMFFAGGSALAMWTSVSALIANVLYFIGSWLFTGGAAIALVRSGEKAVPVDYPPGTMFRAEWLAAALQMFGAVLFNVSTGAALVAHSVAEEKHMVWSPDAAGSMAFLLSGLCTVLALTHADKFWNPRKLDWWSGQINLLGCIAFGLSAVASFITVAGSPAHPLRANWGTFIGAVLFFLASAIVLPRAVKKDLDAAPGQGN